MKSISPVVTEVYENQRYYPVIGWNIAPDFPNIINAQDGQAVKLDYPLESKEAQQEWEISYNPLTDDYEGWQYGQFFTNLTEPREGGRQAKRGSDMVRHRKWVKKVDSLNGNQQLTNAREVSFRDLSQTQPVENQGSRVQSVQELRDIRKAREAQEALKQFKEYSLMKGYGHFQDILKDLLRRNNLWDVVTLDPLAWIFVNQKHGEVLNRYRQQARDRITNAILEQEHSKLRRISLHESDILEIYYAKFKSEVGIKKYKNDKADHVIACLNKSQDLLEMVISSAKFARASYGYVQLAGYMTNVGTFAQMQLGRTNFDPIGQASVEANNKAILKLTGISAKDLLMSEWHNSTFRPCHFVAIDRYQELIVISVRGSLQMGDIYTDLAAKPMEFNLNQTQGYVHQGLLSAATYIHFNTNKALETASELYPNYKVLVTGHSLGAGVAAILSLLLKQKNGAPEQLQDNGIFSINFGSPPTMSTSLCEQCSDSVVSVIHRADSVPSLSYLSFERLLKEVSEQAIGNRAMNSMNNLVTKMQGMMNQPFQNNGFQQMQNNIAKQFGLGQVADSGSHSFEAGLKNANGENKEKLEAKKAMSMLDNFYGRGSEATNSAQSSPSQSPTKLQKSPQYQKQQSAFQKQANENKDLNKNNQQIKGKGGLVELLSGRLSVFNSFKKQQSKETIQRDCLEPNLKEKDVQQEDKDQANIQVQQNDQKEQGQGSGQGQAEIQIGNSKGQSQNLNEQKQVKEETFENGQQKQKQESARQSILKQSSLVNESVADVQKIQDIVKASPDKLRQAQSKSQTDADVQKQYQAIQQFSEGDVSEQLQSNKYDDNKQQVQDLEEQQQQKYYQKQEQDATQREDPLQQQQYWQLSSSQSQKQQQENTQDGSLNQNLSIEQNGSLESTKSLKNRADIEQMYKDLNNNKDKNDLFKQLQPKKQNLNEQDLENIQGDQATSGIKTILKEEKQRRKFFEQNSYDKSLSFLHQEVHHQNLEQTLKIAGRAFWVMYEGSPESWMEETVNSSGTQSAQTENGAKQKQQKQQQSQQQPQTQQQKQQLQNQQQQQEQQPADLEQQNKASSGSSQNQYSNIEQTQNQEATNDQKIQNSEDKVTEKMIQETQNLVESATQNQIEKQKLNDQKILEELNQEDQNQKMIIQQQLKTIKQSNSYLPPAARAYLQNLSSLKEDNLKNNSSATKAEQHLLQRKRLQKEVQDMYSQASQQALQDQKQLAEIQEQVSKNLSEQNPQRNQLLNLVQQAQEQVTKQFGIQAPRKKDPQWIGLAECKGSMFSEQILLHMDMIEDHFPDRYVQSTTALR